MSAIELFASECPDDDHVYFFFDLLCIPNHGPAISSQDWLSVTFVNALKLIKRMLIVISPWDSPSCITRAWSLWEFVCALDLISFRVYARIPATQQQLLQQSILADPATVATEMSVLSFDAGSASAFHASDHGKVLSALSESFGFARVDQRVRVAIRDWYVQAITNMALTLPSVTEHDAELLEGTASVLQELCAFDHSLAFLKKVLSARAALGNTRPEVMARTYSNIAGILEKKGDLNQALSYYERTLSTLRGQSTADVVAALAHLAALHAKRLEFSQALEIYTRLLDVTVQLYGEYHVLTFTYLYDKALVHARNNQDQQALDVLIRAKAVLQSLHNEEGAEMGRVHWQLGLAYRSTGDTENAQSAFADAVQLLSKALGPDHDDTRAAITASNES